MNAYEAYAEAIERALTTLQNDVAEAAALALVRVCSEMQWGGDDCASNVDHFIADAVQKLGITYTGQRSASLRKKISGNLRLKVWDRDGWECVQCKTHVGLTVDHIVPVVAGGTNDFDNLQTLCGHCKSSKGDRQ